MVSQWRAKSTARSYARRLAWRLLALIPVNGYTDRYVSLMRFVQTHGRFPDAGREGYVDYLHRLKVSDALGDPLRCFVTDKEYGKLFVRAVAGSDHVVPTHAVLRSAEEVRNYVYPESCAIKGTHGSGQYIIRRRSEPVDIEKIIGWLSYDHYKQSGERNYRHLVPKVIVEPVAECNGSVTELYMHCYRGEPKLIRVIVDRLTQPRLDVFDCDWQPTGIAYYGANSETRIPRPPQLAQMLQVARKIAAHFESIRVDMYVTPDGFWVGELTNCQSGALLRFETPEAEMRFSELYFGPTAGRKEANATDTDDLAPALQERRKTSIRATAE